MGLSNAQTVGNTFTDVNGYEYEVTVVGSPNEVKVIGYTATDLVIPVTVEDSGEIEYSVTSLPSGVFNLDTSITSVTSSASVAIALQAFNACSKIATVSLPNATSIGNSAFLNNSKLTTVDISSVTGTLGNNTFKGCPLLASINASSATVIGNNCFQNSGPLTTTDFSNVISFGSQSFRSCSATSLSFPALTTLGKAGAADGLVFWQSTSLETVSMPVVETINVGAFNGCTSLNSIILPASLTSISETNFNVFKGCTSLTDITVLFPASQIVLSDNGATSGIFADVVLNAGVKLTVPAGAEADFETADVWKDFGAANIVELMTLSGNSVQADLGWNVSSNQGVVTVTNNEGKNATITVYNITGGVVLNSSVNEGQTNVDISSLSSGVYLFKIETENGAFVKKIVK